MLTVRQQIAIKVEAAAGTAETLAAADVILHNEDATWDPVSDTNVVARNAMSKSLGSRGSVVGARAARIRFSQNLRGTTSAPADSSSEADFTRCFEACGLVATYSGTTPNEQASFKPSSTTISDETSGAYHTIGLYKDGKQYLIHGAQGNVRFVLNNGQPVRAEYEFLGVFNTPTDVALLSPTLPSVVEPPFLGASMSILSYTSPIFESLTIDLGNELRMRPFPNDTAGFHTAQIVRRNVTGTIDVEEALAATKNWYGEWIAGTTGSLDTGVFPSGGANYNQFQFTLPKIKYTGVAQGDREGLMTAPVTFEALLNSDAGDDEIEVIQT
jgi:hypothetical protein